MAVRLIEIHRILKPTGSVFLHCDPTASHYLKLIMDAIWGHQNYGNELIWCNPTQSSKYRFPSKHDVILYYRKTDECKFCPEYGQMKKSSIRQYSRVDEHGRRYHTSIRKGKEYRYYLDESKGPQISSWWADIPYIRAPNKEAVGYPTQKPIKLLERIIKASTEEGDLVLDPFCGCATTCVAAHRLNRRWVGIDVSEMAYRLVAARLEREAAQGNLADPNFGWIEFVTEPPTRTDIIDIRPLRGNWKNEVRRCVAAGLPVTVRLVTTHQEHCPTYPSTISAQPRVTGPTTSQTLSRNAVYAKPCR